MLLVRLAEQLEGQLDPFDDTRVHPECYNTQDWAQRICANALDVQVSAANCAVLLYCCTWKYGLYYRLESLSNMHVASVRCCWVSGGTLVEAPVAVMF